jgi:glycosyltransferase involved in cell wall biosynthesis
LTSISEAQPLSILEAMSCNIPIIATDVGACRELILGNDDNLGQAGIIVPIMDNQKIFEAILYLSNNEKVRKYMGNNGAKRVSMFYNKEKLIEKYKMVYSIACGGIYGGNWLPIKKTY